jgi:hypothetical protein
VWRSTAKPYHFSKAEARTWLLKDSERRSTPCTEGEIDIAPHSDCHGRSHYTKAVICHSRVHSASGGGYAG